MELTDIWSRIGLFQGIEEQDAKKMLQCLGAVSKRFEKGEVLLYAGDTVESFGLVLSGYVQIERVDVWGNRNILDKPGAGQVFAETFACIGTEPLTVTVTAATDTEVLFLNIGKVIAVCPAACAFHQRLIANLLKISAKKNAMLSAKMSFLTIKSIRGRILCYLSSEAERTGKLQFEVIFNRQELADFLAVDRSALSNELSKMQKDGLIVYKKNKFRLLCQGDLSEFVSG